MSTEQKELCSCGASILKKNMASHIKTKKHTNALAQNPVNGIQPIEVAGKVPDAPLLDASGLPSIEVIYDKLWKLKTDQLNRFSDILDEDLEGDKKGKYPKSASMKDRIQAVIDLIDRIDSDQVELVQEALELIYEEDLLSDADEEDEEEEKKEIKNKQ